MSVAVVTFIHVVTVTGVYVVTFHMWFLVVVSVGVWVGVGDGFTVDHVGVLMGVCVGVVRDFPLVCDAVCVVGVLDFVFSISLLSSMFMLMAVLVRIVDVPEDSSHLYL